MLEFFVSMCLRVKLAHAASVLAIVLFLPGCALFGEKPEPTPEPETRDVLTATVDSSDEPIVLLPEETRGGDSQNEAALRNLPDNAVVVEPRRSWLTSFTEKNWASALWQKVFPKREEPPAAIPPRWIGRITLVDERSNFALVDSQPFSPLPPGTVLHSVSQDRETGILRVSADRNPPFFIADITSGSPRPGDRLYSPEQNPANPETPQ